MTDNKMKLNLHSEKTGLTLILRNDNGLSSQDILDAYRLVNRESHDDVLTRVDAPLPKVIDNSLHHIEKAFTKNEEKNVLERKEVKSRPKAVAMVGSERTLSTPIGEIADLSRFDDRVKVAVDCPTCGYSGDITVSEHFKFCKCPYCDLKLFNSWSTGSPGEVDDSGFTYHANTEMIFKNPQEGADE